MNTNYPNPLPEERDKWLTLLREQPGLDTVVAMVSADPGAIGILLDLIRTEPGSLKFFCDKVIGKLSEHEPNLVYPWFADITPLIHSSNHFIQWGALRTIANLIPVDSERKFDAIKDQYLDLFNDPTMITAATVAGNAPKIIKARPDLEPEITRRLLQVTDNTCLHKGAPSPECQNILIGHVLDCFREYYESSTNQAGILTFARSQIENPRKSTSRKAISFVRKFADSK